MDTNLQSDLNSILSSNNTAACRRRPLRYLLHYV